MAEPETNGANPNPNPTSTPPAMVQPQLPAITPITFAPSSAPAENSAGAGAQNKRPRDARLIHMVLASLGISAYQERVPLQLLDFAYRYTSSVLQDALHFAAEGYAHSGPGNPPAQRGAGAGGGEGGGSSVSLAALRLAIASRLHYQFNSSLPKEFLLDLAEERNRIALPPIGREWGVRLPPEKYCLTGVGWGVRDEWESEGEMEVEVEMDGVQDGINDAKEGEAEMGEGGEEEEGEPRMEDLFGEDPGDDGGGGGGGGKEDGHDEMAMDG